MKPAAKVGGKPTWKVVPKEQNRAFLKGEAGKVKWDVIEYLRGQGLDLGCGSNKVTRNAIGIDKAPGLWLGRPVEANLVQGVEKLDIIASESMDFVFSSHALEDIEDYKAALREWWRVVKVGGYLVLYLPQRGLIAPPDAPIDRGGNPEHKHDGFTQAEIEEAMWGAPGGWDLVRNELRDKGDEYSFLQVYKKGKHGKRVKSYQNPVPDKRVAVIRYGGIGDHLMSGTILPVLKAEGWHVTYVTNPIGEEYMRHNPHIDAWIVDTAALVNEELIEFWHALEGRFDRVINMMNSVENVSLPQPGSPLYHMPAHLRSVWYDPHNYNEMTHAWAGVAFPETLEQRYYASKEEEQWARGERKKHGRLILWALAGSSVHKVSPYVPKAVAQVLEETDATVILTGGEPEKKLLGDFADHPRLVKTLVGNVKVGRMLALAALADLVVGPETGMLNSVAMLPTVGKVVWLSHSNEQNLCKHWKNYEAVAPDTEVAPCAPCHRLHWGFDNCRQGTGGAALCVEGIPPERMAEAVVGSLAQSKAA